MYLLRFGVVLAGVQAATCLSAQVGSSIDLPKAKAAFAEAKQVSDHDAGSLWGHALYGPMLFVDPETNAIVANQPDANGLLHAKDSVYTGTFPQTIPVANTSLDWSGTHWTMVIWPLPEDTQARERLMAHELFHRIQPDLHLPSANPSNPQLDTFEGRFWLQLEWRALAAALVEKGNAQDLAVRDALAFRAHRHHLFPNSEESERALDLNEGLAEYTGLMASAPDAASARWQAIAKLAAPSTTNTFVRSFAYTSGPAYGLLLDQRLPAWRKNLAANADISALLASTLPSASPEDPNLRAELYGGNALRVTERERADRTEASRIRYRKLFLDGMTLSLPTSDVFNYGFNPNELIPLGDAGTVYPTMHASDAWGTLEVQQGALLSPATHQLILVAPGATAGLHLQGTGWTLDLNSGWQLIPASRKGSYTLQKAK